VHGDGVPASSAQVSTDAFAAENENDADVDDVVVGGPETIVTEGAGGDAAAATVQVATACADPVALETRTAKVWVPTERLVSVVGDVHAKAGGLLSSAHVVVCTACDVHVNVAVVANVVDGGCWTSVTAGAAAETESAPGSSRAGAAPERTPPRATAATRLGTRVQSPKSNRRCGRRR
jgi:hypothetical protein